MHLPLFRTVLRTSSRVMLPDSENLRIRNYTRYKQQVVSPFIQPARWKNNDNKSFLQCFTKTPIACNTPSRLFNLQRYEAIKICGMLFGNSFALVDYARKKWQTESPMCRCGKSEETAEHSFLTCGLYHDVRPEDIDTLNLLDPEDCIALVDYNSHSTKLNGFV